ncbi:MAG: M56 family metallopeptidase [Lachnospiraceae bacterium]|nr:M56 family metallopeptidase [Lachnospiraceae bacterium]
MELLFLKLVNLSMIASWLVLAVLLIRLVFRKAPKWVRCFLWGLVALRLICPISIESVFSLIPSAEPLPQDIFYTEAPEVHSGIGVIDHIVNPVLSSTLSPEPGASVNPAQICVFVLAWIWAAGVAAMLLYELISYLLLKRRVATATLLRENIKQSESINSPFVLGLFRPVIYLPYSVAEEELTYVIAHEKAHIRRKDHWWKPIGFILLAVYWFNPLLWAAYVLLCRDIEAACDEKVIREMETEDRRAYAAALLHCSVRHRVIAACPLAFGEVGVKARIKAVMNYKKPALWIVLPAVAATIVVAVCLLTVPKRDVNEQQESGVLTNSGEKVQDDASAPYSGDSTELIQPDTGAANGVSLSSRGYTETSRPYGGQTAGCSHDGHHSGNHHDDSHH